MRTPITMQWSHKHRPLHGQLLHSTCRRQRIHTNVRCTFLVLCRSSIHMLILNMHPDNVRGRFMELITTGKSTSHHLHVTMQPSVTPSQFHWLTRNHWLHTHPWTWRMLFYSKKPSQFIFSRHMVVLPTSPVLSSKIFHLSAPKPDDLWCVWSQVINLPIEATNFKIPANPVQNSKDWCLPASY